MKYFRLTFMIFVSACGTSGDGNKSSQNKTHAEASSVGSTAHLSSYDGPFGLKFGIKLSDLDTVLDNKDGTYDVKVPKPNDNFEIYTVTVGERVGVCAITALGKTLANDAFGNSVREVFSELKNSLNLKYGASKDFDFLAYGSIWNEPRDYVMALSKNERTLASFWTHKFGATLPATISTIGLTARGLSGRESYLRLRYEGSNIESCAAEQKRRNGSSL